MHDLPCSKEFLQRRTRKIVNETAEEMIIVSDKYMDFLGDNYFRLFFESPEYFFDIISDFSEMDKKTSRLIEDMSDKLLHLTEKCKILE